MSARTLSQQVSSSLSRHAYTVRLARIRQLPPWHAATQTRLEHAKGTAATAAALLETLRERYGARVVTDQWVRVMTAAALMHDLGHGPWSHSFERSVLPALKAQSAPSLCWRRPLSHEERSCSLARAVLFEHCWHSEDIRHVTHAILREQDTTTPPWVLDAVNAPTLETVDCDRLDYIPRDAQGLRLADAGRLRVAAKRAVNSAFIDDKTGALRFGDTGAVRARMGARAGAVEDVYLTPSALADEADYTRRACARLHGRERGILAAAASDVRKLVLVDDAMLDGAPRRRWGDTLAH